MAAKRSYTACDVCEEQFEYPCRFKRHLATDRHNMFSEALDMNTGQGSEDLTIDLTGSAPDSVHLDSNSDH